MPDSNQSSSIIPEFILVGFPGLQDWKSRSILFTIFLLLYVLTLLGNVTLLILIRFDEGLHMPMYVFLCNLAILDLILPTLVVPKLLSYLMFSINSIEFHGCLAQMVLQQGSSVAESLILAAMAYDRYLAICYPLHYSALMTNKHAIRLSCLCWIIGFLILIMNLCFIRQTLFCGPNEVPHYFCDYSAVAALACNDISIYAAVGFAIAMCVICSVLLCLVYSYVKIVASVLKIASTDGRQKAFSTCVSHLFVVSVFFILAAFVFVSYRIEEFSEDARMIIHVVQNTFPSMVNPIIYCLKTKEVRNSLQKFVTGNMVTPSWK
ncbi:olfactory receptor 6F1 [Latimeria chalumnae]|uniref:olfactory receptor 6F1 n=1 Tax=Latimeria chalumnae TaxID=7897 RepID=UPI0003C1359E